MKLTFYKCLMFFILAFSYSSAFGGDSKYPYVALLYAPDKNVKLEVKCDLISNTKMTCDFKQISVTKIGKAEDLKKLLRQGVKELEKSMGASKGPFDEKFCSNTKSSLDSIKTGKMPQKADAIKFKNFLTKVKANSRHRSDFINLLEITLKVCDDPSQINIESMIRLTHDKQMRTCRINTSDWSETFIPSAKGTQWTSNKGPVGECGIIDIGVFKKTTENFWTYESNRIVTNKKGKWAMGQLSCGEREYKSFYDWRSSENFLGCDYIEGM